MTINLDRNPAAAIGIKIQQHTVPTHDVSDVLFDRDDAREITALWTYNINLEKKNHGVKQILVFLWQAWKVGT